MMFVVRIGSSTGCSTWPPETGQSSQQAAHTPIQSCNTTMDRLAEGIHESKVSFDGVGCTDQPVELPAEFRGHQVPYK